MLHLVINLERSRDRRQLILDELKKFDIKPEIITGIDGKTLTQSQIRTLSHSIYHPAHANYPKELTTNELGCFLSHRKCWERLISSGEEWALIIEDDARFNDKSKKYLTTTSWIPVPAIIQLNDHHGRKFTIKEEIPLKSGDSLVRTLYPFPMGAHAYLINRQTALNAINQSKKITAPVDEFLFALRSSFARKNPTYILNPGLSYPAEGIPSTIGDRDNIRKNRVKFLYPNVLLYKLWITLQKIIYRKSVTL